MKDLKFRIYNLRTNKFDPYIEICQYADGSINAYGGERNGTPVGTSDIYELDLFTVFKDSNGIEIFSGDILSMTTTKSMSTMLVKFENGMFVGEGPFNTHPLKTYFESPDFESMEVYGNIHQNND